jgi:hypothetical protein
MELGLMNMLILEFLSATLVQINSTPSPLTVAGSILKSAAFPASPIYLLSGKGIGATSWKLLVG